MVQRNALGHDMAYRPRADAPVIIANTMTDLSYDGIEVGKQYGPWKYPLKERIARHLEATENQHPWHHERSPWGPPVAPPSLLGQAAMIFIGEIAPLPPGTLHAKQQIETAAALRLDRQPILYGRFLDKYERRGRRWTVFEARCRDETGLLIGHSQLTLAFPERVETADEPTAKKQPANGGQQKGELTPVVRNLTQERMTAYSEDSANALRGKSIHTSAEIAAAAGFPATVAQGLMSVDHISELIESELGQEWYAHANLSVTFLRPALCGDTLTTNGRLSESREEGGVLRKVYNVWSENQRGETVTSGTASSLTMRQG